MPRIFARYLCCAVVLLVWGCKQTPPIVTPVDKVQINSSQISDTVLQDNAPADGVSTNELQFNSDASVDSFNSTVTFSISQNALFSNDSSQITAPINTQEHATASAFSLMPGLYTFTATVGGTTTQGQTTFTTAWPQEVSVYSDSAFLTSMPGISAGITATLLRSPGKVSSGIFVIFSASDSTMSGRVVGIIDKSTVLDSAGLAVTQYYVMDTSYHGVVLINAAVGISPGDSVRGNTRIQMR
jgi:hypothetical protein